MMIDLERQVRDYAADVIEHSAEIDVDRLLLQPVDQELAGEYLAPRPRWAVALAAAVSLLVLIGGLALGYRLFISDEPPVITEPPSTSIPTPTTSVPAPTTSLPATTTTLTGPGAAAPMEWARLPAEGALGAGDDANEYHLNAIVTGGPGMIAVGEVRPVSDEWWLEAPGVGAVWVSEDGRTWDRIADDEGVFGGGYAILDIARTQDGFVAVGSAHDAGETSGAVWRSADGLSWNRIESPSFSGTSMWAVVSGDPGLVAVGIGTMWV